MINTLIKRKNIVQKTPEFSFSFEHLIYNELFSYKSYLNRSLSIEHFRTLQKEEIDFILNKEIPLEIKAKEHISFQELKTIVKYLHNKTFKKDYVVSLEKHSRKITENLFILSLDDFIKKLWNHDFN